MVSLTSWPVHTWEKSLSYLFNIMVERLQTWCACFRQDKNILPMQAIKHQFLFLSSPQPSHYTKWVNPSSWYCAVNIVLHFSLPARCPFLPWLSSNNFLCTATTGNNTTVVKKINKTGNVHTSYWDVFMQLLLQWRSNKYYIIWVRVCSPRYPPCNAQVPYCHLWPIWLYSVFPHYLI